MQSSSKPPGLRASLSGWPKPLKCQWQTPSRTRSFSSVAEGVSNLLIWLVEPGRIELPTAPQLSL